jgi:hypothetical protein
VLGLRSRIVGEPFFKRLDLVAHVEERLECEAGFFEERAAAVVEPVLWEITDQES